jgi:DNA repair/transcription protein MET18/MMS19
VVAMDAMDTSPSSPVWAQDVDVFTSPDRNTTEAARQKGLGAIVAMLNAGELQFLDLLRSMESCLVTTDDARRARGVLLLAEAVTQYGVSPAGAPKRAMPKPAAELLAQFFASKLEDFAVIRAALMGCTFLLNARSGVGEALVTHETARTMADKLFEAVHVPSLVQGDRFRSYEMLLALCSHPGSASPKGPPLGSQSPQEQLEQLIASCDGEKDPRNVLLVCELWKHVPLAFCGSAGARAESAPSQQHKDAFKNAAEELYDVVAAYFPVSFRPPPGDAIKVTHDELASTLRDAMCASPTYAPYAVPHVLESVDSEKAPLVVADALASLAACGAAFGKAAMKPHVPAVWSALRQVLLRPPAGSDLDAEGAAKWATRLFAANWSGGDGGAPDGSLAAMALCDPCLGDAATALAPSSAKTSGCCGGGKCGEEKDAATKKEEDAPHEHTHGGGCCGGEEEESGATSASAVAASSNATEVTNRGHAIVAAAGRVLGAVAAAGPAAAKAALATGVSPLLDAAGIGEDGDVSGIAPGVAPLALVLATPATCGALDGASRHDESSSGSDTESVLGTTGARLVCLFAAAATKSFAARKSGSNRDTTHPVDTEGTGGIDTDDGAVLGVAGLRTLLSFPKGFGLTETSHVNDALLALCAAATASDDGTCCISQIPTLFAHKRLTHSFIYLRLFFSRTRTRSASTSGGGAGCGGEFWWRRANRVRRRNCRDAQLANVRD